MAWMFAAACTGYAYNRRQSRNDGVATEDITREVRAIVQIIKIVLRSVMTSEQEAFIFEMKKEQGQGRLHLFS